MHSSQVPGPEKLRVYRLAQDLAVNVERIIRSVVRSPTLADQLRRAAESVVLNIAEGASHFSPGRKIALYQIARGSAAECMAGLSHILRMHPLPEVRSARNDANMVCVMLTALIRAQESRR
jgi:four helix bundle protein